MSQIPGPPASLVATVPRCLTCGENAIDPVLRWGMMDRRRRLTAAGMGGGLRPAQPHHIVSVAIATCASCRADTFCGVRFTVPAPDASMVPGAWSGPVPSDGWSTLSRPHIDRCRCTALGVLRIVRWDATERQDRMAAVEASGMPVLVEVPCATPDCDAFTYLAAMCEQDASANVHPSRSWRHSAPSPRRRPSRATP